MLYKLTAHIRRISYHLGVRVLFGDHSYSMKGYYAGNLEIRNSRHEENMIAVFRRLLDSRPGVFVDVGVNVGQSFVKVLTIDRGRRYIGFEPQIACCYNLEQFFQLNRLRNSKIFPIALSDSNSILKFYSQGDYDEMASLVKNSQTPEVENDVFYVQARIGDEVLIELEADEICAIKIDVEGAELQVLRGLQKHSERSVQQWFLKYYQISMVLTSA
jgi:FkbM family methyltransferase